MIKPRQTIHKLLIEALTETGSSAPDRSEFPDDMVLLESGLDSMGFAILVTQLEEELGYDPFVLMDEPVYPQTLGEFVAIYEKFAPQS